MKNPLKVTKVQQEIYLKEKLRTDPKWAQRALLVVYSFQTAEEQAIGGTKEYNNMGFSSNDGEYFSNIATHLETKGWLSPRQMKSVFKAMPKYWRQLLKVSDVEKLNSQILKRREL